MSNWPKYAANQHSVVAGEYRELVRLVERGFHDDCGVSVREFVTIGELRGGGMCYTARHVRNGSIVWQQKATTRAAATAFALGYATEHGGWTWEQAAGSEVATDWIANQI